MEKELTFCLRIYAARDAYRLKTGQGNNTSHYNALEKAQGN
jgi:hypothetical protein